MKIRKYGDMGIQLDQVGTQWKMEEEEEEEDDDDDNDDDDEGGQS